MRKHITDGVLGAGTLSLQSPTARRHSIAQFLNSPTLEGKAEEEGSDSHEHTQRGLAFKRFTAAGVSEIHADVLGEALGHLGYFKHTEEQVQSTMAQMTAFTTLDYEEFGDFVQRHAEMERSEFREAFEEHCDTDGDGNQSVDMDQIEDLLAALEITVAKPTLAEAWEVIDIHHNGRIDFDQLMHLMAVYKVTEGFTRAEVLDLSRVFERFAAPLEHQAAAEGFKPRAMGVHRLGDSLLYVFGTQTSKIARRMARRFGIVIVSDGAAATEEQPADDEDGRTTVYFAERDTIAFSEFLIWARRLRAAEIEEYRRQFDRFDDDKSGFIDPDEILQLLRWLGYEPLRDMVQAIMHEVDEDSNGELDFDEFVELMGLFRSTHGFSREEIDDFRHVFEQFDCDSWGEVSCLELMDMLRYLGYATELEVIQYYIDQIDINGTGMLDFGEFVQFMRMHREDELRKVRRVFEVSKTSKTGTVPVQRCPSLLKVLGYAMKEKALTECLEPLGKPASLDFDTFVKVVDQARRASFAHRRKCAGFSDEELARFSELFASYDLDKNELIERHELSKLLRDLRIPLHTVDDQRELLSKLDEARRRAIDAGVKAEKVGAIGDTSITYFTMVHFLRMIVKEDDQVEVERDKIAITETGFKPKELAQFREFFNHWGRRSELADRSKATAKVEAVQSDAGRMRRSPSVGRAGPSSPSKTAWADQTSLLLSLSGVYRVLRSLGLQVGWQQRMELARHVEGYESATSGRIDFPDFLRLMRWMLDTNFEGINNTPAVARRALRGGGVTPSPGGVGQGFTTFAAR